jgi:hypothetical protein
MPRVVLSQQMNSVKQKFRVFTMARMVNGNLCRQEALDFISVVIGRAIRIYTETDEL